ncbi:MAG: hypothetical protein BLM47_12005 [Candidatus Reconcilbacillus cellulovorans]|uniref:Spore coat protein D n=1 Tax=Candidatus Reconcilbacillus cellulovorans TaxID=1906605 RepID=A0A2A6DXU0_9BACL|nr:MAG: hypothetical protein BLM47_12005 [Candidatus Reconcilbacillus cellulovorans]
MHPKDCHPHGEFCCPPARAIVDPPEYVYRDFFHPQIVPVIHPVEIINRHHCVPVPHHIFTFTCKDVCVSSEKKHRRARA